MGKSVTTTRRLYEQQDGKCFYCDIEMLWTPFVDEQYRKEYTERVATFDHIKLKSKGGTYAQANGVCACWKCNTMRSNLEQNVFIEQREYLTEQWDMGNRTPHFYNGELICMSTQKYKRLKKHQENRLLNDQKVGFIAARYAEQIGKTVEDLFLEYVYNSTYEQVRDL